MPGAPLAGLRARPECRLLGWPVDCKHRQWQVVLLVDSLAGCHFKSGQRINIAGSSQDVNQGRWLFVAVGLTCGKGVWVGFYSVVCNPMTAMVRPVAKLLELIVNARCICIALFNKWHSIYRTLPPDHSKVK